MRGKAVPTPRRGVPTLVTATHTAQDWSHCSQCYQQLCPSSRSTPHTRILARDPPVPSSFTSSPGAEESSAPCTHRPPLTPQDPAREISEIKTSCPAAPMPLPNPRGGTQPPRTGTKGKTSSKSPSSDGGWLCCITPTQTGTSHRHQVAFPVILLGHGTNSPLWQVCSSCGAGTSPRHRHQPALCARGSQPPPESRTPTQIHRSAKAKTRPRPRGGEGRGLAALNSETLCSSRKAPPPPRGSNGSAGAGEGPRAPTGERGAPHVPPSPSPQQGNNKRRSGTHRSSWEGWMYPEERMFRDRMLGSMRDSSASGVFRIRPASAAREHHSGNRRWPCEGPCKGQGQPSCLYPSAAPPRHRQQPPSTRPFSARGPGPAPGHGGWDRGILPTQRPGVTCWAPAPLPLQGGRGDEALIPAWEHGQETT